MADSILRQTVETIYRDAVAEHDLGTANLCGVLLDLDTAVESLAATVAEMTVVVTRLALRAEREKERAS